MTVHGMPWSKLAIAIGALETHILWSSNLSGNPTAASTALRHVETWHWDNLNQWSRGHGFSAVLQHSPCTQNEKNVDVQDDWHLCMNHQQGAGACIANLLWSSSWKLYTRRHLTVFWSVLNKCKNAIKCFNKECHDGCSTSIRTWHKQHNSNGLIFEELIRIFRPDGACEEATRRVENVYKSEETVDMRMDWKLVHNTLAIFHSISFLWFSPLFFSVQGRRKGDK